MKKLLFLLIALAIISSVGAYTGSFGDGWATCNAAGNYGNWDKNPDKCLVAWDGITQTCTESSKDAKFTVGVDNMFTTSIVIKHLDGVAETADGFNVMNGDEVLCSFDDIVSDSEIWKTLTCDVSLIGVNELTIHPTATAPWSLCDTYGQVAIKSISYNAVPTEVNFDGGDDECYVDALISGWSVPAIQGGVYGGKDYNDFCLVWAPACAEDTRTASVDMMFVGGDELITINHLDGMSSFDSFDVLVDDVVVGSYVDSEVPSENWITTDFSVNIDAGIHTVTIEATGDAWASCNDWGQLAISRITITSNNNTIPEFSIIATVVVLIGALAIITFRRK